MPIISKPQKLSIVEVWQHEKVIFTRSIRGGEMTKTKLQIMREKKGLSVELVEVEGWNIF